MERTKNELIDEFSTDSRMYLSLENSDDFYRGFANGYAMAMQDAIGYVNGEPVIFRSKLVKEAEGAYRNV